MDMAIKKRCVRQKKVGKMDQMHDGHRSDDSHPLLGAMLRHLRVCFVAFNVVSLEWKIRVLMCFVIDVRI